MEFGDLPLCTLRILSTNPGLQATSGASRMVKSKSMEVMKAVQGDLGEVRLLLRSPTTPLCPTSPFLPSSSPPLPQYLTLVK